MTEEENVSNMEGTDHLQFYRRKGVSETISHERPFQNQVHPLINPAQELIVCVGNISKQIPYKFRSFKYIKYIIIYHYSC